MTSPPTGPAPEDSSDGDSPAGGVGPGYPPPPPGYPPGPPPGYPPGPYGYPYGAPPPRPPSRISVGMAFAGSAVYFVINFVVAMAVLAGADSVTSSGTGLIVFGAIALIVIAFGGGAGLLAVRSPYAKGLGLGLMIGWALTSLFTVGFCTGINPTMYTS